jgi:hypothetical protein
MIMNGRGWLEYKQGSLVTFDNLQVGRLYLKYSRQFDSKNVVQVLDKDPAVGGERLGRSLIYWGYHTEQGTIADTVHATWKDDTDEFYIPVIER